MMEEEIEEKKFLDHVYEQKHNHINEWFIGTLLNKIFPSSSSFPLLSDFNSESVVFYLRKKEFFKSSFEKKNSKKRKKSYIYQ